MSDEAKQQEMMAAVGATEIGPDAEAAAVQLDADKQGCLTKVPHASEAPTALPQPQVPPEWFDRLVGGLFFLYPNAPIRPQTVYAWWGHLGHLASVPNTLAIAFRAAPANCDPGTVPSAELVRRLAEQWQREQAAQQQQQQQMQKEGA